MLIEPITGFSLRYYYKAEYASARRQFEREENYNGFYHAMNDLWDTYCDTLKAIRIAVDKRNAQCFYAQACALWNLYTQKCVNADVYGEPGDIPF